ncbi:MAG: hypothetical protein GYA21_15210 [Myxococcales bacterium]|nr:hypothetical protein [Myxococcales bacterium]
MRAWTLTLLLVVTGCGAGAPLSSDDVVSLRILPAEIDLYLLLEAQLTFESRTLDGQVKDVVASPDLDILATDPEVVRLAGPGRIQGAAAGRTRLVAYFGGRQAVGEVRVADGVLEGIIAEPARLELEVGQHRTVGLRGRVSDGSLLDISSGAVGTRYRLDNPGVAAVTTDGWIFGLGEGMATLVAEHSVFRLEIPVQVVGPGPHLVSLEVSPPSLALRVAEEVQLVVSGLYDDGSRRDVSGDPATTFMSSDTAVVEAAATGRVRARGKGSAVVTVGHGLLLVRVPASVSE